MKIENIPGQKLVALKKELGARNFAALMSCYASTQKAQKTTQAEVKGGKKITQARFLAACAELEVIKREFADARQKRKSRKYRQFFPPAARGTFTIRKPDGARLWLDNRQPGEAIARAKARRIDLIKKALPVPRVSGALALTVNLTDSPDAVGYKSHTESGERYSSRCTYRKTDLVVTATLPLSWISRVYKRGLAEVGGLFNLDVSSPLRGAPDGVTVYAAKWLVSSRGTTFNVIDGFIAMRGRDNFHGKTMSAALAGLRRKTAFADAVKMPRDQILDRARKSAAWVTVADSLRAGNCTWGTMDFCRRNGINPADGIALADLADIVAKEPRPEAFAVMALALAKQRDKKAA